MNTLFMLMAQYEKPIVRLEDCCADLGYQYTTARNLAGKGKLPLPVIQAQTGRKTFYQVHLQDLADYIDRQRALAREAFEKVRAA